jgi:hypothetical protein
MYVACFAHGAEQGCYQMQGAHGQLLAYAKDSQHEYLGG